MAGKRADKDTDKLTILSMIRDRKDVLFAKFSNDIENQKKDKSRKVVLLKAQSIGMCNSTRDWKFVRDKMYGVWKSGTLEKRDNAKKTGKGGGKSCILSAVDNLILDIVGTESPAVEGLGIPHTGAPESTEADTSAEYSSESEEPADAGINPQPSTSNNQPTTPANNTEKATSTGKNFRGDVLRKKRALQVELLEVEIHCKKLKCYATERELGLPHGDITKEIETSAPRHVIIIPNAQDEWFYF